MSALYFSPYCDGDFYVLPIQAEVASSSSSYRGGDC